MDYIAARPAVPSFMPTFSLKGHSSYKIDVEFSMPTCRGVSVKTFCEGLRLKEAAKLLWGLFLVAIVIVPRFDDVTSAQLLEKTVLLALCSTLIFSFILFDSRPVKPFPLPPCLHVVLSLQQ